MAYRVIVISIGTRRRSDLLFGCFGARLGLWLGILLDLWVRRSLSGGHHAEMAGE
jgi:hypothetical protein